MISLTVAFLIRCRLMMHLSEIVEPGLKNLSGGRFWDRDVSDSSPNISIIASEKYNVV